MTIISYDNCHFMINIVVFIDWLTYYCIDTTQRDGSYQIVNTHCSFAGQL